MKIRFISFFLFMLAMSCLVACSDDDPAPDPEPEPEPTQEEQLRADVDFIAAMTGWSYDSI